MTTILSMLSDIASFHGIIGSKVQGVGRGNDEREGALHEVCHITILRAPLSMTFINPDGTSYMEEYVSDRLGELTGHTEDWNEIKSLSCEVHVLRRARMLTSLERFLKDNEGVNWNEYTAGTAIGYVREHIKTAVARRDADDVIHRIKLLSRATREWSAWNERLQREDQLRAERIKRRDEQRARSSSVPGLPILA